MRQVMDYTVTIPRSAVISCDTCNHKYLARGRQRPVCTLELRTYCNQQQNYTPPLKLDLDICEKCPMYHFCMVEVYTLREIGTFGVDCINHKLGFAAKEGEN